MKKITKFLDSVMGGIKRTCIAKALAVFAVASIAINANAQTNEQGVITGIDKLVGKTENELKAAKVESSEAFPTDKSKIFFLYNVKSGKFLTAGGYWGTHASIADYGKPMCVETNGTRWYFRLDMQTGTDSGQGKYLDWAVPNNNNEKDKGVYVDRDKSIGYGWKLKAVSGKTATYKLYTYPGSNENAGKYYLCAYKDQVYADRSCEAYTTTQITKKGLTGYDEWRFFTYDQIYELQKNNADKMNKSLELSFKLKAPGFERGNNDVKAWKTYSFLTPAPEASLWRFGLENLYNTEIKVVKNDNYDVNSFSTAGFTYTFGTDTYTDTDTDKQNYLRNLAKYMCASATQVAGMIYQDVEVTLPGTYVIECKGYSTTEKAALFAGVVNLQSNTMYKGHLYKTVLNQVSGMTAEEKTALHIDDKNMDYAGKAFLGSNQYINQVAVIVPEEAIVGGKATIRLGVMIGDYEKPVAPTAGEWSVFDDFRLLYASKTTDSDLILDELRDELGYLVNSSDLFQNKTLHLNKKFVLNKWNTFVLPVNLTRNQVWSAFGGTTRLAKLSNLTETAIEFESVDLTKLTDEAPAIEAYQPYIIFPGKNPDQTPAYTGNVTVNNNVKKVTIAANHYVIPKVSLKLTANGNNKDFSKMDKDKWATKMSVKSTDGKMEAWGTFARTFDPDAIQNADNGTWTFSGNKGTIITGRDDLKGCYFFDNGKMYHSKDRARGLRGFSCWFKPTTNSTSPNAQLTIDGVTQSGTTGIEDILADYEQPVSRFANGIYNLNGQLVKQGNSTAGLPSGLYIVNGKKCIVR
ncbi:MAG: hypothetical protein MSA69_04345 [Prevotella sp.]|nr:hypothetical protein [Prevotella sp.]